MKSNYIRDYGRTVRSDVSMNEFYFKFLLMNFLVQYFL
jgi:hypothetical protein